MSHRPRITVIGAALAGSGYPNARNTVRLLSSLHDMEVHDQACWLPPDFHLWKLARGTLIEKLRGACLLGSYSLLGLCRLARHCRRGEWVYLPYPSLPVLWCLSWLPAAWRPRCIADAYITFWDTLYQDRQIGRQGGLISRLLLRAESRALRTAHRIVVDTRANAEHISKLFGVDRQRIAAFPLALDQATLPDPGALKSATAPQAGKPLRVLFIGTFVPMQGTEVIARAINLLRDDKDIEFTLIGDGQQADSVAPLLSDHPRVTWLRGWQSPEVLARALTEADICLGVFGGTGKAARVLPFKLYMALAAGKAVVTQSDYSLPDDCGPPPVLTCPADPSALSETIRRLAGEPRLRIQLMNQARTYFTDQLSSRRLVSNWKSLLGMEAGTAG